MVPCGRPRSPGLTETPGAPIDRPATAPVITIVARNEFGRSHTGASSAQTEGHHADIKVALLTIIVEKDAPIA